MKALIVLLVLAATPLRAGAAVIVALPEPELIRVADTIVVATVLGVHTEVLPGGQIVSRADLQVYRAMRGALPNDIITIQVPGGTLANGMVAYVAGAPRLKVGDMVFGFLETSGNFRRPLGLAYGLLRVRMAGPQDLRVSRELDGLTMVSPGGGPVSAKTATLREVPLEDLIARVERRLAVLGIAQPGLVRP